MGIPPPPKKKNAPLFLWFCGGEYNYYVITILLLRRATDRLKRRRTSERADGSEQMREKESEKEREKNGRHDRLNIALAAPRRQGRDTNIRRDNSLEYCLCHYNQINLTRTNYDGTS